MNKIVLIAIVFAAISGVGVLAANIFPINLQEFFVFASIKDFDNSVCTCLGSDGLYSMANCQQFSPPGNYRDPNMLCVSTVPIAQYASVLSSGQGCGVDFWKNHADELEYSQIWPVGYQPNYYYNDMFHTMLPTKPVDIPEEDIDKKKSNDDQQSRIDVSEEKASKDVADVSEEKASKDVADVSEEKASKDVADVSDDKNKEKKSNPANSAEKPDPRLTLLEALSAQGGDMNYLLRQSVAAMLNAAHPEINYPLTIVDIISMTQDALVSEDYIKTALLFEGLNEQAEKPPLCLK